MKSRKGNRKLNDEKRNYKIERVTDSAKPQKPPSKKHKGLKE